MLVKNKIMDNFGVQIEDGNGPEIIEYLESKGYLNDNGFRGTNVNPNAHYVINKGSDRIRCFTRNPTPLTFTLDEIKKRLDQSPIYECW